MLPERRVRTFFRPVRSGNEKLSTKLLIGIMKIFDNMAGYVVDLTNLIWNYIQHRDLYPDNAKLAVQPEVMVNIIDDPSACRHCDFYDLSLLISQDREGKPVPNHLAIKNVANKYYKAG